MTRKEAIQVLRHIVQIADTSDCGIKEIDGIDEEALDMAIKALEREPIDKSAMMYEIYMEGVNMSGEYQGCWVRFKKIEKIVDKYIGELE